MTLTQLGALMIAASSIITARLWLLELRDRRYQRRMAERRVQWRRSVRLCRERESPWDVGDVHSYWPRYEPIHHEGGGADDTPPAA